MTREEAINEIKSWAIPSRNGREVLETLIPELAESEDENLKNKSGYYKAGKFWKASTLWNAIKNKVPQRVPNRYILQECTWNIGTLQRFADEVKNVQEVSLDYPIILDMNGNIIDGAHRVVKAYLEGKDIDIVYIGDDEWPEPDYDEEKAVKESEDERIINQLITLVPTNKEELVAWLNKCKESLHVPETCKENADSFADGIIEVRSFQRGMEEGRRLERQKEQSEEPKIAFGDWGDKEKKEAIITCLKYMRFIKKITNQEYEDLVRWFEDNLVANVLEKDGWTIASEQTDTIKEDYYGAFLRGEMRGYLRAKNEQKPIECIEFDNEFEKQVSHLLASVLNGEWEYNEGFVKHSAQSLLGYAKNELKQELPLMGGDTDTYFDDLRMTTKPLTSREWFDEGIKYAQRLQKEQNSSALQNAFERSVKDYSLEEKRKASDYADSILPTSIAYGESEEEYKLHKIIEAAFIAGQKEQKPMRTAKEVWKEMRLEVYAQASGNRHEPNCSDDSTKMFSLCDIDEIFDKIGDSTVAPAEEDGPFDEDEFLEDELSAFLQNYDKEYDDDAAVSDVARHFYEIGKKQNEQKSVPFSCGRENGKPADPVFSKQEYESHPIISTDTTSAKPTELDGKTLLYTADKSYQIGFRDGVASVKPAEWSEEDADMLNCCISSIEEAKENRYAYKETDGDTSYDREIDWLKSLRPVSKESLQPHWKPSEEQMKALENVIKCELSTGLHTRPEILQTLQNELKKL